MQADVSRRIWKLVAYLKDTDRNSFSCISSSFKIDRTIRRLQAHHAALTPLTTTSYFLLTLPINTLLIV
jgi:hypothetical protein